MSDYINIVKRYIGSLLLNVITILFLLLKTFIVFILNITINSMMYYVFNEWIMKKYSKYSWLKTYEDYSRTGEETFVNSTYLPIIDFAQKCFL